MTTEVGVSREQWLQIAERATMRPVSDKIVQKAATVADSAYNRAINHELGDGVSHPEAAAAVALIMLGVVLGDKVVEG